MIKTAAKRVLRKFGMKNEDRASVTPALDSEALGSQFTGSADPLDVLRQKWIEVPTTRSGRKRTSELLQLSDDELRREWEIVREDLTTGTEFAHRGWYHTLYADFVKGKKI